jgi:membrane-bound serine protease (ClpP class)
MKRSSQSFVVAASLLSALLVGLVPAARAQQDSPSTAATAATTVTAQTEAPDTPTASSIPANPLVCVIPVTGEFENALHLIVVRALREAEKRGAAAIILDMDTPGGRVDSAIKIRDELIRAKIKTYTFVNPMAVSAGSFIALATDTIVMGPNGSIGGALPITVGAEPSAVDEKFQSVFNAEMRKTAKTKGHDETIAQGFCDPDVVIPGLKKEGEILTLDYDEATSVGLAAYQVPSIEALLVREGLGGAKIVRFEQTRTDAIARFLSSSAVLGILMMIGIGGIIVEIKTPGVGLPGAIGISAIGLAFFGSYLANLSSYIEWVIFLIGVGLLIVEVYVLPGFGVCGIGGIALMIGSLFFMLTNLSPDGGFGDLFSGGIRSEMLVAPLVTLFLSILGLIPLFYVVARLLPSLPIYHKLVLKPGGGPDVGGGMKSEDVPGAVKTGDTGKAVTDCYPTGIVIFAGRRHDVISEGEFIEKGAEVVVTRVEGRNIFIDKA